LFNFSGSTDTEVFKSAVSVSLKFLLLRTFLVYSLREAFDVDFVGFVGDVGDVDFVGFVGDVGDVDFVGFVGDVGDVDFVGFVGDVGDVGDVGEYDIFLLLFGDDI
jgi:hypothetical protein